MKELKASDVMVWSVVSTSGSASALDVAKKLASGLHCGIPVVDDGGVVIGIVTELDILNALAEDEDLVKMTAESIMREEVITANADTPVKEILQLMNEWNFLGIPIVNDEKKPIGIVNRSCIINAEINPAF